MSADKGLASGAMLENRYRILNLLGQGGMSRVYLADDLRLGVRVAVKENLQSTPEAHAQFEREAQMLARLLHPNLPRVTDHFTERKTERQYLVMDYIEGEDLDAMIKRVGALPEVTALNWIQQILGAVEYLHSQNPPIIHRDIKPANIKITPQGKAVLVDFGIAKVYELGKGTVLGARGVTAGYAPPEQYGLRTSERSDIYALGATLYTVLTAKIPPEATLRVSGDEQLIAPNNLVSNMVSVKTERVVLHAMELKTDKRFQSVAQLREALEGRIARLPVVSDRIKQFEPRVYLFHMDCTHCYWDRRIVFDQRIYAFWWRRREIGSLAGYCNSNADNDVNFNLDSHAYIYANSDLDAHFNANSDNDANISVFVCGRFRR